MRLSLASLGLLAAGGFCLALAIALGGIAWSSLAMSDALASGRASADEAATRLHLVGALLIVSVVALCVLAWMLVVHVVALVRTPLNDLTDTLRRLRSGALDERLTVEGPEEIRALIVAANEFADAFVLRERHSRRAMATAAIDGLIGGLAHEVNTPVTALAVNEEILYRKAIQGGRDAGDLEHRRELARLHGRNQVALRRLRDLTHGLGEILRPLERSDGMDTALVVRAAVTLTYHNLPSGVRVETDLQAVARPRFPAADLFHALHQIMVLHAVGLTDGDIVTVVTSDSAEGVQVAVRDTGLPLAEEFIAILDDPAPFGIDEEAASPELRNSLRAVRSQGGQVSCRSGAEGSEFRIVLPHTGPRPLPPAPAV